jgi:O-antigen/teichoic acid export membrane protein
VKSLSKEVFSLVDQVVVAGASLIAGVCLGRFGGASELGAYALGMTLVTIFTTIQASIISTPFMVHAPRFQGWKRDGFAASSILQQMFLASAGAIVSLGVGGFVFANKGNMIPEYGVFALAFAVFGLMGREHLRSMDYSLQNPVSALRMDCLVVGLQIPLFGVLIATKHMTAAWVFAVLGISVGVVLLGQLYASRVRFAAAWERLARDISNGWRLGRWLVASGLVWAISTHTYVWLLAYLYGTESAGAWAACVGALAFARVPLIGLQNTIGPNLAFKWSDDGADALVATANRYAIALTLMVGATAFLYLGVGDWLLVLLYGPAFANLGSVIFVLALNLCVTAAAFPYSRALFVLQRADVDFWANLVSLTALATLGLMFTKSLGIMGAAIGLLVANTLSLTARCVFFRQRNWLQQRAQV